MKKKHFIHLSILFLMICTCYRSLSADDIYAPVAVYSEIADICHPTLDDYRKVQNYLTHGERSIIKFLGDYEIHSRNLKIIGDAPDELPEFGDIAVNCDESERENCLILYASFNKNYPKGLKRIIDIVKNSDYKGHILYRIGGWPDPEGGALTLAHVPYAFKVSFFKEAQRLGYKRAFWLDTSIVPLISMNHFFEIIKKQGHYIMNNNRHRTGRTIGPYMSELALQAFPSFTLEETYKIPSCSAGICGIDFTHPIGAEILERLWQAASHKVAFFSPRSDQNALSIILYQMGVPLENFGKNVAKFKDKIKKNDVLFLDRLFVE